MGDHLKLAIAVLKIRQIACFLQQDAWMRESRQCVRVQTIVTTVWIKRGKFNMKIILVVTKYDADIIELKSDRLQPGNTRQTEINTWDITLIVGT